MKHLKRFNEDVYYEPRYRDKTPSEIEDEIHPIVEEWINDQVGEEIASSSVMRGGTEIHVGVSRKKVEADMVDKSGPRYTSKEEEKAGEEASKEEWVESSEELIEILDREGYGIYTLGGVTKWGMTLWRDEKASGGPISIKVKERGF